MPPVELVNPGLAGESFFWPGGPVGVLLSHGFTATAAEVRPLAEPLAARGYTVAGPLLPGHGTTPAALNACRWQDWRAALEAAYAPLAARCERVFVGGESMGALLALLLAADHPAVAGLLLYSPALETRQPRRDALTAALLSPWVAYLPKPAAPPSPTDARWQGYPVYPLRAARQLFQLQAEVRRRLPEITAPALLVQGRQDHTIHPASSAMVGAGLCSTDQTQVWLEHSTHCVILDEELPQLLAATLQFIERHQQSPRAAG